MAIHYKTPNFLVKVMTIAVVALFVVFFAGAASAFTLSGKVMSIDKGAKTLTVDPSYYSGAKYGPATELRTFAFAHDGQIWMGNEKKDFDDIKVGDLVTVNYHQESGGLAIADGITVNTPASPMHPAAQAFSLTGKVVSIDKDARTLSVDPEGMTSGVTGIRTFSLDNTSSILRGSERASLDDIKVGDIVSVNYHQESGGRIIADSIAINPPVTRYPEQGRAAFSLSGKIAFIDKDARTITLEPSPYAAGERSFYLDNNTSIMMGDRTVSLNDLNVGDNVTVNYHQESNGRIIADSVAVTLPELAPFPAERG